MHLPPPPRLPPVPTQQRAHWGLRETCQQIPLQMNSVHDELGLFFWMQYGYREIIMTACTDNGKEGKWRKSCPKLTWDAFVLVACWVIDKMMVSLVFRCLSSDNWVRL